MQGFFLGAGASYELGMPLVIELTEILKRDHAPALLRKMQSNQQPPSSLSWSEEATETLITLLADKDLHYEAVIGAIEVEAQRTGSQQKSFDSIRQHLVDMVSRYLIGQHSNNFKFTMSGMSYLSKLTEYIENNKPLNIFSLNHDVMIEEACTILSQPLKAGHFNDDDYYSKAFGEATFDFKFESLTEVQMSRGTFDFHTPGERGINLYKLHGALDTFLFNDCKDFVRFSPKNLEPGSHIQMLQQLQKENHRIEKEDGIRTIEMMTLKDSSGEVQFFDRSLVTGAFKFQAHNRSKRALTIMFERFKSAIYGIQDLICVGYGFGDLHVNEVIVKWLCSSKSNRLIIVDPFIDRVPSFMLHLKPQIELLQKTFFGFLSGDSLSTEAEKCKLHMHQQFREFKRLQNLKKI